MHSAHTSLLQTSHTILLGALPIYIYCGPKTPSFFYCSCYVCYAGRLYTGKM